MDGKDRVKAYRGRSCGGLWPGMMAAACVAVAGPVALADAIHLQKEATATGDAIALRDVARLEGEHAEALGDVTLARFDKQDKRTIDLETVRGALDKQAVNWSRLSLSGFRQCQVTQRAEAVASSPAGPSAAAGQDVKKAEGSDDPAAASNVERAVRAGQSATLRQRLRRVIEQMHQHEPKRLRISFQDRDAERLDRSVLGEQYEIEPRTQSLFGRVPIAVRHYQNGQVTEQFTISATVKRQVTAMVATDTIRRDSRFDPGKVEQQTVWLSRDREPVKEMDLLAGQRADGVLREGDLVYPDDVASPVLVERRDLVTVRCLSGGLVVRTVARALDEGSKGDVIRVRNESSRETFTCKVTGPREAVVEARNEEGAVPMAAMQGEK